MTCGVENTRQASLPRWPELGRVSRRTDTARDADEQSGFFWRLRDSLGKSRRALTEQIAAAAFDPGDDEAWERLEEALIAADVGVPTTAELVQRLEAREVAGELGAALSEEADELLGGPPRLDSSAEPTVILVVGVNGTGKTTTIGKLAQKLREHGHSVLLAAADTFRAAAEEQLEIWAEPRRRGLRRLGARGRPGRGRLRRDRGRDGARARRRDRRHRRPAAHADEPDGGAREGAPRDRAAPARCAARDAARRRCHHRPERPPAGAALRRGRRRDRRRPDQAGRLGEGRCRARDRPRARSAGQARGRRRRARRPPAVRRPRLRERAC